MTKLEFSEEQQAFHFNRGEHKENSNGYRTILEDSEENIKPILNKLKDIRDTQKLTFKKIEEVLKNE